VSIAKQITKYGCLEPSTLSKKIPNEIIYAKNCGPLCFKNKVGGPGMIITSNYLRKTLLSSFV
jgi:hypothetical protein